jgi:release factor glutamine methyltransferase
MKIKELRKYGNINLINEDAYKISKLLLMSILNVNDTYLIINDENDVPIEKEQEFIKAVEKINIGYPVQYITNSQQFYGLDFYVDENVLIPQPDTEVLVEKVIEIANRNEDIKSILDICTGSGAIGISLAKFIKNMQVDLTDISTDALAIANKNAIANCVSKKCSFIKSDMFDNLNKKYDIIVSNPPYIETDVIKQLSKEVQNEPLIALDGGKDGLYFYKKIANEAYKFLNLNGFLALEIGFNQKDAVIRILEQTGKYKDIYCLKDFGENDRVIIAQKMD